MIIWSDIPKSSGTDGNLDGCSRVDDLLSSDETSGTVHSDTSDSVLSQMLGDLEDKRSLGSASLELNLESVENRWEVLGVKVDIDDGTNDGLDGTDLVRGRSSVSSAGGD